MACPKRVLKEAKYLAVDRTSSLNSYVICDSCDLQLKSKEKLLEHLTTCVSLRTCTQCNQVFKRRGILFSHSLRIHGVVCQVSQTKEHYACDMCPRSYKYEKLLRYHQLKVHKRTDIKVEKRKSGKDDQATSYECKPCSKTYKYKKTLQSHVRGVHFNLMSTDAEVLSRKTNEVWYERVLNTDMLVRIKKAGRNKYLLKRTLNNGSVKICSPKEAIDITSLYPPRRNEFKMYCYICDRYLYVDLEVHIEKCHGPEHLATFRRTMEIGLKKLAAVKAAVIKNK